MTAQAKLESIYKEEYERNNNDDEKGKTMDDGRHPFILRHKCTDIMQQG